MKHYQQVRKVTILLTSHYMKDIAALCQRVVIIAQGRIIYDGSLSGIVDRFSGHKVLTLQFADDQMPSDLARYGEVIEIMEPKAKIRVDRAVISSVLAAVLADHTLEDVSVEDPPARRSDRGSLFAVGERGKDGLGGHAHPTPAAALDGDFCHNRTWPDAPSGKDRSEGHANRFGSRK